MQSCLPQRKFCAGGFLVLRRSVDVICVGFSLQKRVDMIVTEGYHTCKRRKQPCIARPLNI